MLLSTVFQTVGPLEQDNVVFPRLGIDINVDSTAFKLFGVGFTWYGVIIALGMMLAMIYGFSRMRKFGLDPDRAIDGVIGGVIGGIIGARVYFIIFHWTEYAGDWRAIFNIRNGGLAIYGGIIGALLVGSAVCKLRKVRLLPMFDIVSLGFLIGQGVGRWGNFTNHEAFGCNTDGLFGMSSGKIQTYISQHFSDGSVVATETVHPCFLYESAWCLLGFVLLHIVSKKWRKFDGQIFLMYLLWYGIGRFFIEGLRTDSLYLGTVRVSQALALITAVAALVLLIVGFSRVRRMGGDYVLYVNSKESQALLEEADRKAAEYAGRKSKDQPAAEEKTAVILAEEEQNADAAQAVPDAAEDAVPESVTDVPEPETAAAPETETVAEPESETAADAPAESGSDTEKPEAE